MKAQRTRPLTICSATVRIVTSGLSKLRISAVNCRIVDILWRSRAICAADAARDHEIHFSGTFVRSTRSGI
jgi:hypothetical protein